MPSANGIYLGCLLLDASAGKMHWLMAADVEVPLLMRWLNEAGEGREDHNPVKTSAASVHAKEMAA